MLRKCGFENILFLSICLSLFSHMVATEYSTDQQTQIGTLTRIDKQRQREREREREEREREREKRERERVYLFAKPHT